jgi:hypothetical protein
LAAGLGHPGEERVVDRWVDHDPVARLDQQAKDLDDGDADLRRQRHVRRIDLPPPPAGGEPGQRLRESGVRAGVADVGAADRGVQRLGDRHREREVHLGDGQRQHVRGVGSPLRAPPPPQLGQRDLLHRDHPRLHTDSTRPYLPWYRVAT